MWNKISSIWHISFQVQNKLPISKTALLEYIHSCTYMQVCLDNECSFRIYRYIILANSKLVTQSMFLI